MKRLALLGASGHGKVVADIALLAGWDEVVFFDDAWPDLQSNTHWAVCGSGEDLLACWPQFDGVAVSIGHCPTRLAKQRGLAAAGAPLTNIVHPSAVISRYATLGAGCVVMAGAVINTDAVLGEAVIVNTGATVDHDCRLGHAVHICPGAHLAGNVQVGECSWIGLGAAVRQGVSIGGSVMVGAGAVVVAALADGLTVVGNPAKPIPVR